MSKIEWTKKTVNCITCKNAYIKDGVYLICDIFGIQNDVVKDCKNYEAENEIIRLRKIIENAPSQNEIALKKIKEIIEVQYEQL